MLYVKLFVTTFITVFFCDMIWLGGIAKNLYAEQIGKLLRQSSTGMAPNWSAAVIVYIAIAAGIICFVLPKANGSASLAFAWGAVFGCVTYAIYDFTNFSVLADWPLKITLIDCLWGTLLCGITSLVAYYALRFFS